MLKQNLNKKKNKNKKYPINNKRLQSVHNINNSKQFSNLNLADAKPKSLLYQYSYLSPNKNNVKIINSPNEKNNQDMIKKDLKLQKYSKSKMNEAIEETDIDLCSTMTIASSLLQSNKSILPLNRDDFNVSNNNPFLMFNNNYLLMDFSNQNIFNSKNYFNNFPFTNSINYIGSNFKQRQNKLDNINIGNSIYNSNKNFLNKNAKKLKNNKAKSNKCKDENIVILKIKLKIAPNDSKIFELKKYDDLFVKISDFFDMYKIKTDLVKPTISRIFSALDYIFYAFNNKIGKCDLNYLNSLYKLWIKNNKKIPKIQKNIRKNNDSKISSDSNDSYENQKIKSNSFQNMDKSYSADKKLKKGKSF